VDAVLLVEAFLKEYEIKQGFFNTGKLLPDVVVD
jgi:hypothetical protein